MELAQTLYAQLFRFIRTNELKLEGAMNRDKGKGKSGMEPMYGTKVGLGKESLNNMQKKRLTIDPDELKTELLALPYDTDENPTGVEGDNMLAKKPWDQTDEYAELEALK